MGNDATERRLAELENRVAKLEAMSGRAVVPENFGVGVPRRNQNPIAVAREGCGVTQTQLATRSKLSITTIRNAERGVATTETVRKIASALGVPFDSLVSR